MNKLKIFPLVICFLVATFFSENHCAEQNCSYEDVVSKKSLTMIRENVYVPAESGLRYYTGWGYNYTQSEYNTMRLNEEMELFKSNQSRTHLDNAKKYNQEFLKRLGDKEVYNNRKEKIEELISLNKTYGEILMGAITFDRMIALITLVVAISKE